MAIKKEYLEFLDKVEHKAIKSVTEKWKLKIQESKDRAVSKHMTEIDTIQNQINCITDKVNNLVLDMEDDINVSYNTGCYSSIEDRLRNLSGQSAKDLMINNCRFTGAIDLLEGQRNKEIEEVKANYHKVRVVCKSMTSGKKISEYLTDIGFDLTDLEKENETALVADIDKSKLFVCGEKK